MVKFSEAEEQFIKENYSYLKTKDIAEQLGRSYSSTESKIKHMRKKGKLQINKNKRLTQSEEQFIKENHRKMTYKEIAKQLGITELQIRSKVFNMGWSKKRTKRDQRMVDYIRVNYSHESISYKIKPRGWKD